VSRVAWGDPEEDERDDKSDPRPLLASEWFGQIHSGSAAIEFARAFLSDPSVINFRSRTPLICMMAAELIYRVTGELVAPEGYSVTPETMTVWSPCNILVAGPLESA